MPITPKPRMRQQRVATGVNLWENIHQILEPRTRRQNNL